MFGQNTNRKGSKARSSDLQRSTSTSPRFEMRVRQNITIARSSEASTTLVDAEIKTRLQIKTEKTLKIINKIAKTY